MNLAPVGQTMKNIGPGDRKQAGRSRRAAAMGRGWLGAGAIALPVGRAEPLGQKASPGPSSGLTVSSYSFTSRASRAILVDEHDKKTVEALWSGSCGVLHTVLDMGSVGWPGRAWGFYSFGIRGER